MAAAGCAAEPPPPTVVEITAAPTAATTPIPTPIPTPEPTPEPTPTPPADEITGECRMLFAGGEEATRLADRDHNTKYALDGETTITVVAGQSIGGLYVIWDLPPDEWTAECGEERLSCGQAGFIHEYVTLPSPASEVVLTLGAAGGTLCDIYVFTGGAPPDWVQTWLPPWDEADILLIPTHADDEHLWFGGIMPYYAGELGCRVQVAYLTNHWAEPPRPHELLNGLWTVGIKAYPVIGGFRDRYAADLSAATARYPLDEVVAFQVELLRRFRPSVVVAQDENGEYGHGAHILNTYALKIALEAAADAAQYPESAAIYGTWDTPKTYIHLYGKNRIVMDWSVPLAAFGGRTALEMAREGYLCHESQQHWGFAVRDDGRYDCRRFGLYRTTVGPDAEGGDLMENITRKDAQSGA